MTDRIRAPSKPSGVSMDDRRCRTPPLEEGSPTPAGGSGKTDGEAARKDRSDSNPLAPPVNIEGGS